MYLNLLKPTLTHNSLLEEPITEACELIISKTSYFDMEDKLNNMWEVGYAFTSNKLGVKTINSWLYVVNSENLEEAAETVCKKVEKDKEIAKCAPPYDTRTSKKRVILEEKLNNLKPIRYA